MTQIPPNFGGFLAFWREEKHASGDHIALLARYGKGRLVEDMEFTPLNLLQAHKTLGQLIERGKREGRITEEHLRQSNLLPSTDDLNHIIPRDQVDRIAGEG